MQNKRAMILLAAALPLAATPASANPGQQRTAEQRQPLRDCDGAPACGNIGQHGRPRPSAVATAVPPNARPPSFVGASAVASLSPTFVVSAVSRAAALAAPLLRASASAVSPITSQPLRGASGEPACGNVPSKAPRRC